MRISLTPHGRHRAKPFLPPFQRAACSAALQGQLVARPSALYQKPSFSPAAQTSWEVRLAHFPSIPAMRECLDPRGWWSL